MNGLEPEVEKAVDVICARGCDVVSAYIKALQRAQVRPEYQLLDAAQRASLLRELQSIMAVYDDR
jgi:hypothetical protein